MRYVINGSKRVKKRPRHRHRFCSAIVIELRFMLLSNEAESWDIYSDESNKTLQNMEKKLKVWYLI